MSTPPTAPLLIRQADVWTPTPIGVADILIGGGRILAIEPTITGLALPDLETIDASGQMVVPGLVDLHCHVAGAGGEGGPTTRTPELTAAALLDAGITSVVGLLGADGVTRGLDNLLMKIKALREHGLGAWMWTGSYQFPPPTLTGSVSRDIALFDEVIGVGEVAIADHRSSSPTAPELIRLAKEARLGGMLGSACGIVHVHLGDADGPFALLDEAVASSELTHAQFLPTHVNRNAVCFGDALEYGRQGPVDVTTSAWPFFQDEEVKPSRALRELLGAGVPPAHISMSTDAGGSLPEFDATGALVRTATGDPRSLWREVTDAIADGVDQEVAIAAASRTPARRLALRGRGEVAVGVAADLLLVDADLRLRTIVAAGEPHALEES